MVRRSGKKLLASSHTGKCVHHRHTSYGALALLLALSVVPLVAISQSVAAAEQLSGEGQYGSSAVVVGPVPSISPNITSPSSGVTYVSAEDFVIRGSCAGETMVKVTDNGIFTGAALCTQNTFSIQAGLFEGENVLVARSYNTNEAASPESSPVTIQFNPTGMTQNSAVSQGSKSISLTSQQYYRGVKPGEEVSIPFSIQAGTPPYAVSVSWGDGKNDLYSQPSAGTLTVSHTYKKPGSYKGSYTILIRTSDAAGQRSILQVVAIVNDGSVQQSVVGSISKGYAASGWIRLGWQLLAACIIGVGAFWLGEKREQYLLLGNKQRQGVV